MDTSSPLMPLLRVILPKVPLMGKTALSHTLGLSEHSKHWDLRTTLTVTTLRSFLTDSPPQPLSKIQRMSLKAPEIKGRIWVSKVVLKRPEEEDVWSKLQEAIDMLRGEGEETGEKGGVRAPGVVDVEAEWTGYRAGATRSSVELKISEEDKYKEMMKEVESPVTVLYFHGGAYYLMDPATHRPTTKKLAKLTKGRCLSIRYRLAPQHPFPAALLDALIAYLTLLYPPPGSLHAAVAPEHIVLAGDSAGGNLALALLQLLLHFQRHTPPTLLLFNNQHVALPLPAGVATCSPWTDITHSSPSCKRNLSTDYLPPLTSRPHPADEIWPASPPRNNLYAADAVLTHPLVSPLSAPSWHGSCPLYIATGTELLTDEDRHVAAKAARQGARVVYDEFEAMPHCFAMMLEGLPVSRMFFERWAGFMRACVEGAGADGAMELKTKGTRIRAKTLVQESVAVEGLSDEGDESVLQRMTKRVREMSGEVPDTVAKL
ncbi:alpha/beta-Hydrolase [Diplocarpon rosae]|nr:alpha/beta-Hydrolase [Diplocarpon rosae]